MARLTAALAILALLALAAGCGGEAPAAREPAGSTLEATLTDADGDGFLGAGPAEPLRDRTELAPAARPGRTVATFAQLTDAHVRDEESPARTPFLDRLGPPFTSTFRPQEALSPQVLTAAVRAVNRLRPQAVAVTGDLLDSAQQAELDQALAVLGGGRVRPDTGRPGYDGVQGSENPDPLYFRPDNDAPRRPGVLDAAQRPFTSPGLDAPWFPALGNHDLLAQGEIPPTPAIDAVATGTRMLTELDPDVRPSGDADAAAAVAQVLAQGAPGRSKTVAADPRRAHLSPAALVARLQQARPGALGKVAGRLDYAFEMGGARGVMLDTVNRAGGSTGLVLPEQVAWLQAELTRAGTRPVVVFSHNPLESSDGGETALTALAASPNVVAAVSGHRHRNVLEPHPGGFWLVGTASLADFPQQARAFRLVQTAGGRLALETWMVDHDGRGLAGTARELAHLDAQGGRPQRFAGAREDRNARLYLPAG